MAPLASTLDMQLSIDGIFMTLPVFQGGRVAGWQGGSLFNNLSSLIGQRTVIDSQFVQVFLL